MSVSENVSRSWPGERLGLPASGSRSVGRLGRRLLALAIDWGISVLISSALFSYDSMATLGIFVVIQVAFGITLNASIGHLVTGLRIVPLRPGYLGYWRPVARAVLIALVIPAVIWDTDQRGLHDRWCGTILVRR